MSNLRVNPLRLVRKVGPLPTLTHKYPKHPGSPRYNKPGMRDKTPGQHGRDLTDRKFLRDKSAYGLRLWEKQKLRFNYNIGERQLVRYVRQAKRSSTSTGDTLLSLLEMRLDNIVFRLGFSRTIVGARQLVSHGHIRVNGEKLTLPSYTCARKDQISVKPGAKSRNLVQSVLTAEKATPRRRARGNRGGGRTGRSSQWGATRTQVPKHLSFNPTTCTGVVERWASRQEVRLNINPLLVVEFYSGC